MKSFKPSPVEAGNITIRVVTDQIAQQQVCKKSSPKYKISAIPYLEGRKENPY